MQTSINKVVKFGNYAITNSKEQITNRYFTEDVLNEYSFDNSERITFLKKGFYGILLEYVEVFTADSKVQRYLFNDGKSYSFNVECDEKQNLTYSFYGGGIDDDSYGYPDDYEVVFDGLKGFFLGVYVTENEMEILSFNCPYYLDIDPYKKYKFLVNGKKENVYKIKRNFGTIYRTKKDWSYYEEYISIKDNKTLKIATSLFRGGNFGWGARKHSAFNCLSMLTVYKF